MPEQVNLAREVDQETSEGFAERLGLDPEYELVTMDPVQGYGPIVDAWVEMLYPLNVDEDGQHGVIQGLGHRHARQFPDGSGVYESTAGGALYATRTPDGTVVWNATHTRDPWPYQADAEAAAEINVPYTFVGEVLTQQSDLDMHDEGTALSRGRDEDSWVQGDVFMRGVVRADILDDPEEEGVLLEHQNGAQVYVGYDSTAHRSQEMFGFVPFDGSAGIRTPSASDALDLLRPDEALAADKRQGEWFLAETDGEPKGTIQKPGVGSRPYGGSPLDSHVPREWKTHVHDAEFTSRVSLHLADQGVDTEDLSPIYTPQDVFDAMNDGEIDTDDLSYEKARELAEGVYIRGTIRHRDNEHRMEKTDEWHQPTTHDYEVITDQGDRTYAID